MNYETYNSEEEYEQTIAEERQNNPDTFFDIVLSNKYMSVKTGLSQGTRDFELRYGRPIWKRYGTILQDIHFPAEKPLITTQEIVRYRTKIGKRDAYILKDFDVEKIEDDIFRQIVVSGYQGKLRLRNFRDAYNYTLGKVVNLPHSNINIKADSDGIPQLQRWG